MYGVMSVLEATLGILCQISESCPTNDDEEEEGIPSLERRILGLECLVRLCFFQPSLCILEELLELLV